MFDNPQMTYSYTFKYYVYNSRLEIKSVLPQKSSESSWTWNYKKSELKTSSEDLDGVYIKYDFAMSKAVNPGKYNWDKNDAAESFHFTQ